MATYTPVVDVNITINVVRLAQAGFGVPIFIDAHTVSADRTTDLLTSLPDLVNAGFSTDSRAYKAAEQFYTQSPTIEGFKIGRRAAAYNSIPQDVSNGSTHSITIDIPSQNTSQTFSATSTGTSLADVASALATDINAALSAYVTATSEGGNLDGYLKIAMVDKEVIFQATDVASMTGSYVGDESAANCLTAIREEDDEWYFVATHDRDVTWVEGMALAVETASTTVDADTPSYGKMYFHASSDVKCFNAGYDGDVPDYSIFDKLRSLGYTRTVNFFHQTADQAYPECAYIGHNAPYGAGTVTWANITLIGLQPSSNPDTGRRLTSGQKQNLASKNGNFIETDAGVNVVRFGITASQEWIDVIRGVDWLTQEVEVAIKQLLFAQKGGKIPYTDQGIAQVREVIHSALQSAVNRNFLQSFELTVPLLSDILSTPEGRTSWINRVLDGVTFVGYLAGAIHTVTVNGSVEAPTSAVV